MAMAGDEEHIPPASAAHEREDPPRLLSRPAEPRPLPSPVRQSPEVATIHVHWAEMHGTLPPDHAARAPQATADTPGRVRSKVRARMVTAATEVTRRAQQSDHALLGELIRAVDAVAGRVDDLGVRLGELEALVQEFVDVVSEDLVSLRVTGEGAADGERSAGGRRELGGERPAET